ncbi:hypothetical protein FBY36_4062 [Arthrobacter sp. SLBN-122]|nr:hypothetical protein FBY36_4062 [Arthrobacter sp. SLBN-122]
MPKQALPTAGSRQDKRGLWRIGRQDLEDYIAEAYRRTGERIAAGEITDDGVADEGE